MISKRHPDHWLHSLRDSKSLGIAIAAVATLIGTGAEPYKPMIDPSNFQATVDNPYFPLQPGTVLKYEEKEGGETFENEVTVTSKTRQIMGVTCIVVHDVVRKQGEVKEDTWDWYAQDKRGTIWYFGEATTEYEANGKVTHKGSWEAATKGAQPGIIMPADPQPDKPYKQEYSPHQAEDMAQVIATNETVTVPAGRFTGCIKIKEWSLIEPGKEDKWYAKGVGLVRSQASATQFAALQSITRP